MLFLPRCLRYVRHLLVSEYPNLYRLCCLLPSPPYQRVLVDLHLDLDLRPRRILSEPKPSFAFADIFRSLATLDRPSPHRM